MARMIPSSFDQATPSAAERTLFHALQNTLDDRHWTVIHSLPWLDDGRHHLVQGECDFLLLHPEKGMLAVEAKSGAPSYDGQERRWRHRDDDGRTLTITDPFAQARASSHHLNDLLQRRAPGWRDAGLPFGYAVAFPDAAGVMGNLPPEMTPDLLILEPDLERLQTRVTAILARFSQRTGAIDPGVFKAALDVLLPEFRLVPSLKTTVAGVNRELVRLTGEQAQVLDGMARNRRMYVCGGAGTGKTLLVAEQARRMARELAEVADRGADAGAKARARSETTAPEVLVLCYNNSLEAHLRQVLADVADQVEVLTFHGLCRKLVEAVHGPAAWTGPGVGPDADAGKFWNEELPEQAFDCLEAFRHRYRAVLVDEAQDFHSVWWMTVEGLLAEEEGEGEGEREGEGKGAGAGKGRKGRFFIFGDEGQDLYGRGGQLPFVEPAYELKRNCRNTRQIAQWVRKAAGLGVGKDLERLPEGPEVEVMEVADEAAEVDAVRKKLHQWLGVDGIRSDQVVVLGRHRMENSCFGGRRKKLGNWEVVAEGEDVGADVGADGGSDGGNGRNGRVGSSWCVRYATIHKFKGLEADFVVLVGVGGGAGRVEDEGLGERLLYVGGSRARVGLLTLGLAGVTEQQNS